MMTVAADNPVVATVEFGPGLFEEDEPEIVSLGVREGHLAVGRARDVVVDYYFNFLAVFRHLYSVNALWIDLLR